jgi:glycine oxidase
VIGLAVAWRAQQHGMRTVVLERTQPGGGTTRVAAGMLGPIAEATSREEKMLALGLASARAYPAFVAELARAAEREQVGYLACGTLLAARDRDEAEALTRELELRQRLGLRVERMRASAARALEPALAPSLRLALMVPDDHAVDPRALVAALALAAARAGAIVRTGAEVRAIELADGRLHGVALAGGERVPSPKVVIAAGVWSSQIAGIPPASQPPLRAVKGQILRLHDPAGPGLLSRVVRLADGAYVVPRGDGRYVIGATMEERGFDTSVSAGAVFELLRDATELVPGISELVVDELSAGLRPATTDNAPVIGPSEQVPGLYWATGHYRNGILLAPITAELVVEALIGQERSELGSAFAPGRFAASAAVAAPAPVASSTPVGSSA